MNFEAYKAKKRELAEKLKDLNEQARLDRLNIGREARLILEKERRKIRKLERKQIKVED
jgi:hypothetical protein